MVMAEPWDPFTPETAAESSAQNVAAKFRPSLVARAEKRTVVDDDTGWAVHGDPKLGDAHDQYFVVLDPATHKYACSCYGTQWGDVRQKRICSHVLAVILHRRRVGPSVAPAPEMDTEDQADVGLPDPTDPRFGRPPLPSWVKALRPHQWQAVLEIVAHFESGKKAVLLDAPTGAGKTLIGELARRMLHLRAVYMCTTKQLQGQFLADFDYARVLKGRANYPTLDYPHMFADPGPDRVTCDDCTKADGQCDFCFDVKACPYEVAKTEALEAQVAVLNTAYFLAEANHVGRFQPQLVTADEADELEPALMSFVEISVGPKDRQRLGLGVPEKKTVEESWVVWLDGAVQAVTKELGTFPDKPKSAREAKRKKKWERKLSQLTFVRDGVASGGWVYDHSRPDWVTFKPIKVDRYAQRLLWRHAPRWLLMSATTISFEQMAAELGLEDHEWASVSVPSTFPPERRPIRIAPVADLTYKTEETEWVKAAEALVAILAMHPDDAVLVHTQSYRLNDRIHGYLGERTIEIGRPVYTYRDAQGREAALAQFRALPRTVLLAPSLQRGVSLDDESCRVVVVVKVPYPSMGDPQVKKRVYATGRAGQVWYGVKTVRSLVQATGRGMRHADDWCTTYILDRQFPKFFSRNRWLFPRWWKDALDQQFDSRKLRRK